MSAYVELEGLLGRRGAIVLDWSARLRDYELYIPEPFHLSFTTIVLFSF